MNLITSRRSAPPIPQRLIAASRSHHLPVIFPNRLSRQPHQHGMLLRICWGGIISGCVRGFYQNQNLGHGNLSVEYQLRYKRRCCLGVGNCIIIWGDLPGFGVPVCEPNPTPLCNNSNIAGSAPPLMSTICAPASTQRAVTAW